MFKDNAIFKLLSTPEPLVVLINPKLIIVDE